MAIGIALLFFLILASYSNTFHASWQFDDKPNIVNNQLLHIKDLKPETLFQTFYTNPQRPSEPGNKLNRPISYLTFAINWYLGQNQVFDFHIVNLLIHFLTAVFLYLTILNLFKAPNLIEKYSRNNYFIALIAAGLWAVNPIQTQAVTYIVQRMASIATMFYILSMLFYLKFRLNDSSLQRILLLLASILSFLLAMGSKENAAMLPASLLVVELTCFQNFNWHFSKRGYSWALIAGAAVILLSGIWFFNSDIGISWLGGYQNRPFTIVERLLTQPRIVMFYLSQIFLPLPHRLSVEHDVFVSTSLWWPWTTLPAILLILCLVGFGISQIQKRPIIALPILFFFLNHFIESSFFPLELVFEHRNYLPSLFLFLPVAAGLKWLYDYFKAENRAMAGVVAGFLILLLFGLGTATYIRNAAWATEFSLWRDAMHKAPRSARPLTNLAWQMAYGPNSRPALFDEALKLYQKALSLQKARASADAVIMNNMSGIYFRKGEHQKAIDLLESAVTLDPDYTLGRYDLATILIVNGKWDIAEKHTDYLLGIDNAHEKYLCLKGLLFMHAEKYDMAIEYFRRSLASYPFLKESLMNLGIAYSLKGDFSSAEVYLIRAHQVPPKNSMIPLMGLIANTIRAADYKGAQKYAGILSDRFSRSAIDSQLEGLSKDLLSVFLSAESISTFIEQQYQENNRISS